MKKETALTKRDVNIVSPEGAESIADLAKLTEKQKFELLNLSHQIVNCAAIDAEIEAELRSIREDLKRNPDPRVIAMRNHKKRRSQANELKERLLASYNGAVKIVLADIPGETMIEKYKALGR